MIYQRKFQTLFFLAAAFVGFELMAATVQVQINGMQFVPAKIQINQGDTVEFVNNSTLRHTVTADPSLVKDVNNIALPPGALPIHSGTISPQGKFSQKFTTSGHYKYTCLPHELMGMQGEIEVLPSAEVACSVSYFNQGQAVTSPQLTGHAPFAGGAAISEDFELLNIKANLHVFLEPASGFISINLFHEASDSYLNVDTFALSGKPITVNGRNFKQSLGVDSVAVTCQF